MTDINNLTEKSIKVVIGEGGRIVIPASYRKALGLKPGDEVQIELAYDEIRIISYRKAISNAQKLVHRFVNEDRKLSEELISERREESDRG